MMNELPQGQRRVVRVKRATSVAEKLEKAIILPTPERAEKKEDTAAGKTPSPVTAENIQTTPDAADENLTNTPVAEQPPDEDQLEDPLDDNSTDKPGDNPKSEPPRGEDRPEATMARPRRKRPVRLPTRTPEKIDLGVDPGGARRFRVPRKQEATATRPVRFTTYLRHDVHGHVQRLHRDGSIVSITALVNAALRSYLEDYYDIET